MSFKNLVMLSALALLWAAAPAHAQTVKLRFHDGLVSLSTQNAPLRAILAEWARLGGATIVNAERVVGPPLTLELNDVPERQALDTLLRNVSGYMLGARAADSPGTAVFNRILILPTSSGPRNPPPSARPRFPTPQPILRQPPPMDPGSDEFVEEEPPPDGEPVEDDAPVVSPFIRRGPRGIPGSQPMIVPQPEPDGEPQPEPEGAPAETETETPRQPGTPFSIPAGATSRPGVIVPLPEQPQQREPRNDPDP